MLLENEKPKMHMFQSISSEKTELENYIIESKVSNSYFSENRARKLKKAYVQSNALQKNEQEIGKNKAKV